MDERERGLPIASGDEVLVAGVGVVDQPDLRCRLRDDLEDSRHLVLLVGDLLSFGQCHYGNVGVERTHAVGGDEFLLSGVSGLPGEREVDREAVTQLSGGPASCEQCHQPEQRDDAAVTHHGPCQTLHCILHSSVTGRSHRPNCRRGTECPVGDAPPGTLSPVLRRGFDAGLVGSPGVAALVS